MTAGIFIAETSALLGDPARANMLAALMGGQALTAGELARLAGVTPQTASGHLAKLQAGKLVGVAAQGRHRYYRLASPEVARLLEGLMSFAVDGAPRHRPGSLRDEALAHARTCYDHIAGRLGVALADALGDRGFIHLDAEGGAVTPAGRNFLAEFGLDLDEPRRRSRAFCRPCLDWSERRWHLGGALGARLATRCFELGWIRRGEGRALTVTPPGRSGFLRVLGVSA